MVNGIQKFKLGQKTGKRKEIRGLGKKYIILKKDGHTNGTDKDRKTWCFP